MYNRISIIGGSGTGKSTLTDILSKELNIPAIHIDAINYEPNWKKIDKIERDKIILSKINEKKWIIDGNYTKTLQARLNKSDLIIWLDYSTSAQLKGVFKRYLTMYKKERPEIPGCKERFNIEFIKNVASHNKEKRPILKSILKNISEEKILIFKKQKDLNNWLIEFTHNYTILSDIKNKRPFHNINNI